MQALKIPVGSPVMALFGKGRDLLFVSRFKEVAKAACKFHILQAGLFCSCCL
jgi:hypothetical protein